MLGGALHPFLHLEAASCSAWQSKMIGTNNDSSHAPMHPQQCRPHVQVFLKQHNSGAQRRCWRSLQFLRIKPGCHHFSIMQAHSGGPHGITLRMQSKHSWKCAKLSTQRIPARYITHPQACACAVLPPDNPVKLDPRPSSPPPTTTQLPATCPTSNFNAQGWEVCAWKLASRLSVPPAALDLEGVPGLDVRLSVLCGCCPFFAHSLRSAYQPCTCDLRTVLPMHLPL
jgi:hypothetical protein